MPVQLMNQKCNVCNHPETAKLNVALIAGTSTLREIEKSFSGISKSSLDRHKRTCLPSIAAAALQSNSSIDADDYPSEPETVDGRAREMASVGRQAILLALKRKDTRTAFAGMRELRGFLELMGKISGELSPQPDPRLYGPMFIFSPGMHIDVAVNQRAHNVQVVPLDGEVTVTQTIGADSKSAEPVIELLPQEVSR